MTAASVHAIIKTVPRGTRFINNCIRRVFRMIEMREELFAAPVIDWQNVPFVVNHHKWWLQMYRFGDKGDFFIFSFVSPKGR